MTRVLCSSRKRGSGYSKSGCSPTLALIIPIPSHRESETQCLQARSPNLCCSLYHSVLPLFRWEVFYTEGLVQILRYSKRFTILFSNSNMKLKIISQVLVLNSTGHKNWELPHFCVSSRGCFAIWCILWWCLALLGVRVVRYYARCSWALDFFLNMRLDLCEESLGKIGLVGMWLRCEMCSSWYWK